MRPVPEGTHAGPSWSESAEPVPFPILIATTAKPGRIVAIGTP
ncbi:hypothetical protein RB9322 [Rhodopirellula baltica SH 1]|uniref:Uncharacterized protein n=1 Tax=Rhodopirellula baltica (strain DSM 10527 / NCIMB 13988 / SH1) TaxID=243090 RepID=Q7ULS3_RHOBA|nr:hypothetical protein RB9322 [Rhodopirellula baltica SH 1]